jgi:hypothetical protein
MCSNAQTVCLCTIKVHVTHKKSISIKALYVQTTNDGFGRQPVHGRS